MIWYDLYHHLQNIWKKLWKRGGTPFWLGPVIKLRSLVLHMAPALRDFTSTNTLRASVSGVDQKRFHSLKTHLVLPQFAMVFLVLPFFPKSFGTQLGPFHYFPSFVPPSLWIESFLLALFCIGCSMDLHWNSCFMGSSCYLGTESEGLTLLE